MKCAFLGRMLWSVSVFGRGFQTSFPCLSTTFSESLQPLVLLSKQRSPTRNWPETQLGPIDAIHPRYSLPGFVGLTEIWLKTENHPSPTTLILPPLPSHHHASIMIQTKQFVEDLYSELYPLVPKIDTSLLKCVVNTCPRLLKSDLSSLFHGKDFSGSWMTTITFSHHNKQNKISEKLEYLTETASYICILYNPISLFDRR
uniref:2OG-FeII_Oxy_2 domain-containing protein n=1 Tax=Mesocestoides corti TaxID=53468 RepID=A0A5K3F6J2_MESCO